MRRVQRGPAVLLCDLWTETSGLPLASSASHDGAASASASAPSPALRHSHGQVKYTNSTEPIPEFPIPPESAYELLLAADYLNC
jgi:hypothetical protein